MQTVSSAIAKASCYLPEPLDGEGVWTIPAGYEAKPRPRHVLLTLFLLMPVTVTASLGTISFSASDSSAISHFWPTAAFQIAFSIWFGLYGVLAGVIGPMLGNALMGGSPFLFVPANVAQCVVAAWCFRHYRLDPRLRGRADWFGLIVVCCLLGNALGTGLGLIETWLRGTAVIPEGQAMQWWVEKFFAWFNGNAIPSLILVPLMFKAASPLLVRGLFFCPRFAGSVKVDRVERLWGSLNDLPMMAKLMLLTLVAGIIPLSVVAGYSVLERVKAADFIAVQTNRNLVREIRTEIERHELLLKIWAARLEPVIHDQKQLAGMIRKFQEIPQTFRNMTLADRAQVESRMSAAARAVFRRQGIAFFNVNGPSDGPRELCAVVPVTSDPRKVLTGCVAWRDDNPLLKEFRIKGNLVVVDDGGRELYRYLPAALAGWHPKLKVPADKLYTLQIGRQRWHVAQAEATQLGWRFIRLTGVKAGQAIMLAYAPKTLSVMINLAIFGSMIAGSYMARRITERVLTITEQVEQYGAIPGELHIGLAGNDELGYLGNTLDRISLELAENIKKLQETTAEKERLSAEMDLARQVQQSILPKEPPELKGYELAAFCRPAREVGGDFYDYFTNRNGGLTVMIGDAVGKGLRAAMFITETHGLAHVAALEPTTPEQMLNTINRGLISSRHDSFDFVTMFCAALDGEQHCLQYASAGHNPPILLRGPKTEWLELGGLPLAVSPESRYEMYQVDPAPGDTVVMYTDGVTEAMSRRRELFGAERLKAMLQEAAGQSAREICETVIRAVADFTRDAPQSDDITLLVLRRCEIQVT